MREVPRYLPKMDKRMPVVVSPEIHQVISFYATKRHIKIYQALNELVKLGLAKIIEDGEMSEDELK